MKITEWLDQHDNEKGETPLSATVREIVHAHRPRIIAIDDITVCSECNVPYDTLGEWPCETITTIAQGLDVQPDDPPPLTGEDARLHAAVKARKAERAARRAARLERLRLNTITRNM